MTGDRDERRTRKEKVNSQTLDDNYFKIKMHHVTTLDRHHDTTLDRGIKMCLKGPGSGAGHNVSASCTNLGPRMDGRMAVRSPGIPIWFP